MVIGLVLIGWLAGWLAGWWRLGWYWFIGGGCLVDWLVVVVDGLVLSSWSVGWLDAVVIGLVLVVLFVC